MAAEEPGMLSLIGNTPVVTVPAEEILSERESTGDGNIRSKLEFYNPTGSMKDRIAYGIIKKYLVDGVLEEGDLIVEASSGNTAGGVSFVASQFGFDCLITCPQSTSRAKIGYVEALGAELVLCEGDSKADDDFYRNVAADIAEQEDGIYINQYQNDLNPRVHYHWTGVEIWEEEAPDILVCPMGTGGTTSGIGKRLKERDSSTLIVGVDAERSNISNAFYDKPNVAYETEIEGLGKGEQCDTMWFDYIDDVVSVADETALSACRSLARHGYLVGPSSAATLHAAVDLAQQYGYDTNVVGKLVNDIVGRFDKRDDCNIEFILRKPT
jgi:cystathionine beta-synthase/cysteine synthase A